jgi:Mrp family chromosome partitioning ATPase
LQNRQALYIVKEASGGVPLDVAEVQTQIDIAMSDRVAQQVARTLDMNEFIEQQPSVRPFASITMLLNGSVDWVTSLLARLLGTGADNLDKVHGQSEPQLDVDQQRLQAFALHLQQGLLVRRPGFSHILQFQYTSTNPQQAARLSTAFAWGYIEAQQNARREALRRATEWMEDRASDLRRQAEAAARAAEEFRIENGRIVGSSPIDGASPELETAETRRIKLKQLDSAAQMLQTAYNTFLQRYTETAQQVNAPGPDAIVINDAVVPKTPSFPRKKVIIALGSILGGGLGLSIALARQLFSRWFTVSQLPAFGYRCLGTLPLPRGSQRSPAMLRVRLAAPGTRDSFSEAIRSLKVELEAAGVGTSGITTIGVTAPTSDCAASLMTLNLAEAFARSVPTLLVDSRTSRFLTQALAPSAAIGFHSLLSNKDELRTCIVTDPAWAFSFLPNACGIDVETALTEAHPKKLAELLDAMRDSFAVVIFDIPPVQMSPGARALASILESFVVVATVRTTTDAFSSVSDSLDRVADRVLGVVLESRKQRT